MKLVAPAGTAQPLAAVSSGRADLGLADLIDVTLANRQGAGLRVVAAVVQRPLISLMARADGPIRRPRDLVGHTVGPHRRAVRPRRSHARSSRVTAATPTGCTTS